MNGDPICPCDVFVFPKIIANPPGLPAIQYRQGDFLAFREALVRQRPDEIELLHWRPTATGDLALQLLEWWAYLADILTFYNERTANESYLRTAVLPESLNRLIRILGYRPRPGIGATGVVAALLSTAGPITIPKGFPLQSKPGPGKQPQVFEVDADTLVGRPDVVAADAAPDLSIGTSVLVRGTASAITVNERLLLLKRGWAGEATGAVLVTVSAVGPEKAPRGRTNTRVTFTAASAPFAATDIVSDYSLLRSSQSIGLWPYTTAAATIVITSTTANLAAIARQLEPGAPAVFDLGTTFQRVVNVTAYQEIIWFANPKGSAPEVPPDPNTVGIAIPHSVITFTALSDAEVAAARAARSSLVVRFGWRDVGDLIGTPATGVSGSSFGLTPASTPFPEGLDTQPVLLEDAIGHGADARATGGGAGPLVLTDVDVPSVPLQAPLRVLFDVLGVSRGQTVATEILGSGDATKAGQEFVLQKSPLTYLQTTDPAYPDGYKSTLRVWVDGVEWTAAPSFFEQPPAARIFVTREDESNRTHVLFGEGINGARLSSGINNVAAQYRFGSGANVPDPGKLTVITRPVPGLKSIDNPVSPGGGSDPDSPTRIRQLAPKSILTFGRAVSGDDYEVIAAQTPSVARARAYWAFDAVRQRTVVTVYVGDTPAAVTAARTALAASADPNRPVIVKPAFANSITLQFTLLINPLYQSPIVEAAVRSALLDPDTGLFSVNGVRIGDSVFQSQIEDACLRTPGAVAIHSFGFVRNYPMFLVEELFPQHSPGEGGFFQLQPSDLIIATEVAA